MMKKIAVWVMAVIFFAGLAPVFAADKDRSGPNPSKEAYEHANEHARFKRSGDVKDKEAVKAAKKAEKEAEKEQRRLEKEAKRKQKEMEKASKKMNKGFAK